MHKSSPSSTLANNFNLLWLTSLFVKTSLTKSGADGLRYTALDPFDIIWLWKAQREVTKGRKKNQRKLIVQSLIFDIWF